MDLEWLALIIPASYYLISTIFLCFPNILHSKQKYRYEPFNHLLQSQGIYCIGHRGGGWEGPQNTIEIFSKNYHRSHMFQLDVCLTKDKKLVVHHDFSTSRTCGRDIIITQTNYDDLPCFQKEYQSFNGPKLISNHNKIPLLEEMFQKFPDKPMNIQLKTPSQQSIKEFNRIVTKYERQNITVWGVAGSMNQDLRNQNPEVVNFYSAGQTLKIFLLFITGLLPFVCIRQGVLDIPLYSQGFYNFAMRMVDSNCKKCLVCFAFSILRCFNFFSRLFIPHLKKRGILTFYFILNTEEDYENALSTGCSGIMTDLTADLQEYLKKKGVYYENNGQSLIDNRRKC